MANISKGSSDPDVATKDRRTSTAEANVHDSSAGAATINTSNASSSQPPSTTPNIANASRHRNNTDTSAGKMGLSFNNAISSPPYQHLISKGRQTLAEDEKEKYESEKIKIELAKAKADRDRLEFGAAALKRACDLEIKIEEDRAKLAKDIKDQLRAQIEAQNIDQIRDEVYQRKENIASVYEHQVKGNIRADLANALEPVIKAELAAQLESSVKRQLRNELIDEVKKELREELAEVVREELRREVTGNSQLEKEQNNCREDLTSDRDSNPSGDDESVIAAQDNTEKLFRMAPNNFHEWMDRNNLSGLHQSVAQSTEGSHSLKRPLSQEDSEARAIDSPVAKKAKVPSLFVSLSKLSDNEEGVANEDSESGVEDNHPEQEVTENHYRHINNYSDSEGEEANHEALSNSSRGTKRSLSVEEEEELITPDSKRARDEFYRYQNPDEDEVAHYYDDSEEDLPSGAEEYSESETNTEEPPPFIPSGIILETNTEETPFVIDDSDDEDKTLVEPSGFNPVNKPKIFDYDDDEEDDLFFPQ